MTSRIRTVIVDDEPPARRRIRSLLQREADVEIVAECRDGREAIAALTAEQADLVFLDVQMPEVDGFGVVAALPLRRAPVVIFVTAYDEFALRAFEVHALDYLLKPFDRERFQLALARARERILSQRQSEADLRLLALVEGLKHPQGPTFQQRFPVKDGDRIHFVDTGDLEYIAAAGNYVELFTAQKSYLVRDSLGSVEARLDPALFLRIHRGTLVRIDRIRELEPLFQGEYLITLRGGARVRSSRGYRAALHRALNLPG
jgi:two-component system, LytTR family, response regulator